MHDVERSRAGQLISDKVIAGTASVVQDVVLRALQEYDWRDGRGADADAMAAFIAARVAAALNTK